MLSDNPRSPLEERQSLGKVHVQKKFAEKSKSEILLVRTGVYAFENSGMKTWSCFFFSLSLSAMTARPLVLW